MLNFWLIAHLLGASVWVGGHLILAIVILPKALRAKDVEVLLGFESNFEKIGMPALALQIITGLYMAHQMMPDMGMWFALDNDISILIALKLLLLFLTALVAMHARFRVIPKLSAHTLQAFSVNIILVTLLSVAFLVVGTLFRTGLG